MSLRDTCVDSPVRRILIRLAAGVPFGIYELKSQIGSGKVADWLLFQPLLCPLATVPFFFLSVEFWLKWNQTLWLILAAGSRPVWRRSQLTTARLRVNDTELLPSAFAMAATQTALLWLALTSGRLNISPSDMEIWSYLEVSASLAIDGSNLFMRECFWDAAWWPFIHMVTRLHVGSTLSVFTLAEPDKGFHSLSYHIELTV